jgi:hypothetical protein
MSALRLILKPIRYGWSVRLSDGRELARFLGPGAKWRAMRYLHRTAEALKNSGARHSSGSARQPIAFEV